MGTSQASLCLLDEQGRHTASRTPGGAREPSWERVSVEVGAGSIAGGVPSTVSLHPEVCRAIPSCH